MGKKVSGDLMVTSDQIQNMVPIVRGQRVMLDSDLARLYGVGTKRLNEQVARNRNRFPDNFAYQLTQQEFTFLRSQIATSRRGWGGRRNLNRLMERPETPGRHIGFHARADEPRE